MTQSVFPDIDPNVTSGTQLATLLNDFKASILTQHSGASQPTYIQLGGVWIDDSVANVLTVNIYDGTQDIALYAVDTVGHIVSYGGNNATSSFRVIRTDTAADMLEMFRNTPSATNGGLIFSQINDNATKRTMGAVRINSDSVADTAEEASVQLDGMVAGSLTQLLKVDGTSLNVTPLSGVGDSGLQVDASGNITRGSLSTGTGIDNLFANGKAISADDSTYTATGLSFSISSTASELIDSTRVFKAITTVAAETLETETITLKNGNLESPLILSMKYKCATDWTVEIVDENPTTIKTFTLPAYVPTANENDLHKAFVMIPAGTVSVTVKFTSTAADTLLYDDLQIYSWSATDEPLHFRESLANLQTNTALFTLINRKNSVYKIEGQITREDATLFADGIYKAYISFDTNGSVWRIASEELTDIETDLLETTFDINGNDLRYSTNDFPGAGYAGSFKGRITRVL